MNLVSMLIAAAIGCVVLQSPLAAKTMQVKNTFAPHDKLESLHFDQLNTLQLTMQPNARGHMTTLSAPGYRTTDEFVIKDEAVSSIEINNDGAVVLRVAPSTTGAVIVITVRYDEPKAVSLLRTYTYTSVTGTTHTLEQRWSNAEEKSSNQTGVLLLDGVPFRPQ